MWSFSTVCVKRISLSRRDAQRLGGGHPGLFAQLVQQLQPVLLLLLARALRTLSQNLKGLGGGDHDAGGLVPRLAPVLLQGVEGHGGVGVDEVVVLLINAADHGLGLRVVAEIASEPLLQLLPHPVADLIGPGGGQLGHVVLHLLVILGQRQQEPLQVAGDQDVHGGRDGVVEGAVAVIAAGAG